ncbi:hypothetical protein BSIN_4067 [Burkholderia singularis]|uniref:Uncharacterized protein n=1 Tax=Burkholderia singularis TaxID=1503053 RepID=A0A238H6M1_9BURK|nr:hypothetical protein BSIN_4067 [Burkholderia singularis]
MRIKRTGSGHAGRRECVYRSLLRIEAKRRKRMNERPPAPHAAMAAAHRRFGLGYGKSLPGSTEPGR